MTNNPDYVTATNMAYHVLSLYEELPLPIYVKDIIKRYIDIKVYSYAEASIKFNVDIDIYIESSDHGFTMIYKGNYIILYNGDKNIETIRFTLAHELGHYILEHVVDDEISGREANCFARNILCPIPVIKELNMQSVNEYIDIFAVSEPMASASMNLANYDFYNIDQTLYSKMQDLLMCHMTGCSLSELYGHSDNVISITSPQDKNKFKQKQKSTINDLNAYVSDDEIELLDHLKFGE